MVSRALKAQGFDFERWAREAKGNVYFACYESFGNVSDSLYDDLLHLSTTVEQKLQTITGGFSDHTIGLHIRRTDNYRSIAQSPLYLFENKIKEEIEKNPDTCIFLATDDEPTKKTLTAEFPGRILTSSKAAERGTVDGIQDALAEMYALASCERIYGSAGSSFSIIASGSMCPSAKNTNETDGLGLATSFAAFSHPWPTCCWSWHRNGQEYGGPLHFLLLD